VKFDEVMSMQFPERWELEARLKGFVFFRGRLFAASLRDIARRYGLVIAAEKQQFTGDLRGMSVRPGCVRGRVRVLFESTQLDKIQDGEVLVTSMTTPDLLPAVRRAIAFVTDEGNITCDAAVLARGERKPFVTGTGYATEYLKDGDMVEVDADAGVVRVLERFS
jgi:phosphoenolpyruvate synthase/pyruvate phosphate dikinase